jgi:versiconal hemiacetal acetate reductase
LVTLAAGVLTHPWEDRTDTREQQDVFFKLLFRGKEVAADKEIVARVQELAKKKELTMAQVAMGWVFSKGGMIPICGLNNKDQIDQAVEGMKVTSTEEECKYNDDPYVPKMIMGY